ncbi:MAG: ATP phosphoribosyltransferase [Chloroflexota bacterium]
MKVRIALPKGRLLSPTSALLERTGWGLSGYTREARLYRLTSRRFPKLEARMLHERDIPVQVAVGNYDLGICGRDWVEELLVKYPSIDLVEVRNLGYGAGSLYLAASRYDAATSLEGIQARPAAVRMVSEYANLAESYALNLRLRRFTVSPLWGAAEVYPPENADLALVAGKSREEVLSGGLQPVDKVLDFSAFLIANKRSWETRDLSEVLASLGNGASEMVEEPAPMAPIPPALREETDDFLWLALPDGHQQQHTVRLLNQAGIKMEDYPSPRGNRRPGSSLEGVRIKVIRPQDMPLQVANGNFDLAVTGRDWLREHLYQFPSSPVVELLNLGLGRVRLVAVVSQELPISDTEGLREMSMNRETPLRVCSEYIHIADRYACDNHLGRYRVIPTWGASEAFVPEDADLLIENTETGGTIARHGLKIIDTLFESTACLISNRNTLGSPGKAERIEGITGTLRKAVEQDTRA